MVSVRPVSGALMDFPHTFLNPALGFAVGVTYWFVSKIHNCIDAADVQRLSQCLSTATLTASAVQAVDSFSDGAGLGRTELIGVPVGLYIIINLSNPCVDKVGKALTFRDSWLKLTGQQIYGNIKRVVKWFKIFIFVLLWILMTLVKARGKLLASAVRF